MCIRDRYKGGYATRAWRISGRPSTNNLTDYGVHSASPFQTSTEIHPNSRFLDKAPPGVSRPQYIDQGEEPIKVELDGRTSKGFMSRIMLQCHNSPVGAEIHEISDNHERRATKATIDQLEHEFSDFVKDPESIILLEKEKVREYAANLADVRGNQLRLIEGADSGFFLAYLSLNPGEPGEVYLKAFEVTTNQPLSITPSRPITDLTICLLYTSPSPRDATLSRMPSSA